MNGPHSQVGLDGWLGPDGRLAPAAVGDRRPRVSPRSALVLR